MNGGLGWIRGLKGKSKTRPVMGNIFLVIYIDKNLNESTTVCSLRSLVLNYIPPPLTVHFPMIRSVRYQPILHTLYYTLHTEHAYCLSYE